MGFIGEERAEKTHSMLMSCLKGENSLDPHIQTLKDMYECAVKNGGNDSKDAILAVSSVTDALVEAKQLKESLSW
jgi:hypothetical protein